MKIVAVGLILIVIGATFCWLSRVEMEVMISRVRTASKIYKEDYPTWPYYSNTWSLEGSFSEGEYVGIDFRPSWDWSLEQFDEEELPPGSGNWFSAVKRLDVNITNPKGESTCFGIYLVITKPNSGDASAVTIFPDYFRIDQNNGLLIDEDYPKPEIVRNGTTNYSMIILGRAPLSGVYKVKFNLDYKVIEIRYEDNKPRPWIRDPIAAPYVWLYAVEKGVTLAQPYAHLLYLGLPLAAFGIVSVLIQLTKMKSTHKRKSRSMLWKK
ncbi:MAG: hypothetical protein QXG09_05060 [Candidatus Bathyarchaeia archaeon]